jgi:hypothetical protein
MHPLPLQRLERSKAVERLELLERLVFIAGGTRSTAMIPVTWLRDALINAAKGRK